MRSMQHKDFVSRATNQKLGRIAPCGHGAEPAPKDQHLTFPSLWLASRPVRKRYDFKIICMILCRIRTRSPMQKWAAGLPTRN